MAPLLDIAGLCIVAGLLMAPLRSIAALCIVAGVLMAPLLSIAALCIVAGASHTRLRLGSMDRPGMRGGREMADIAGESNGYTGPRRETRNNVTSEFGDAPPRVECQRASVAYDESEAAHSPVAVVGVADGAGARNITTTGQIGDGREAAAVEYVLKHAGGRHRRRVGNHRPVRLREVDAVSR